MPRIDPRTTWPPFVIVCLFLVSAACLAAQTQRAFQSTRASTQPVATSGIAGYKLDSGDQVKVTVYGEDDLSGTCSVDGNGNMQLPLIGQVHAGGSTVPEFQSAVEAKLSQGYLVNPRVSAEVTNYRLFTILGEVNKPGEYPYENGMTVLNAVALGGG